MAVMRGEKVKAKRERGEDDSSGTDDDEAAKAGEEDSESDWE